MWGVGEGEKLGMGLGATQGVRSERIILTDLDINAKVMLQLKANTSPLFLFYPV